MKAETDRPVHSLREGLLTLWRAVATLVIPILVLAAFLSLVVRALGNRAFVFLDPSMAGDDPRSVVVSAILAVYLGAGTTRILARALPLRANGRRRWVVVASLLVLSGLVEGVLVYVFYDSSSYLDGGVSNPNRDAGLEAITMSVSGWLAGLVFIAGVIPAVWTVVRHLRRHTEHGVLYLRRFGSRGDTAVMRLLLSVVPRKVSVAFIAGPSSNPTSWDLSLLLFAGVRPWRPWSNVPLFLRSADQTWKDDIRQRIATSKAIAIDVSQPSASLFAEAELIDTAGAGDRTISLLLEGADQSVNARFPRNSRIVLYELTWKAAFPRIVVGMLGVLLAGFYVLQIPGAIASVAIAAPLLLEPSPTRHSRELIRRALLDALTPARSIAAKQAGRA